MNAHEYRKTLTDRQKTAFGALLEEALRNSGWYSKNIDANNKSMSAYYEGQERHRAELDEAQARYDEARAQIEELREQIRRISDEADERLDSAKNAIGITIAEENREIYAQIGAERGDAKAEREIIEQMVINQYQSRLDKKSQKGVA